MSNIVSRRILIVEDNALVGEHIADLVHRAGAIPLGPLCTTEEVREALDSRSLVFDAAIVDMHLDEPSDEIADRLDRMQVPFIFATGNRADIPAHHRGRPVCEKPFTPQALLDALRRIFPGEQPTAIEIARCPGQVIYLDEAVTRRASGV